MRKWISLLEEAAASEDEKAHKLALKQTGFWGRRAAGCIFLAKSSGRVLLGLRSEDVEQPHTYGSWGGAIDDTETSEEPATAVMRELREETQYDGDVELIPLYVFKSDTFRYFNYLAVVDDEFEPVLNWEHSGYEWCDFGDWPSPLHFGIEAILNDLPSVSTITSLINIDELK